jgi:alpha-L-fucosidase
MLSALPATLAALGASPRSAARNHPAQSHPAPALQTLQQDFLNLRFGLFICLNTASYSELEWADPNFPPAAFNPARLDCAQWARAAKSAGMTYGCLTTKHHDGFCIWRTRTTPHSVAGSPFGRDVVKEYTEAFRAHGLKPVLYYSILDFHHDIRPRFVTRKQIDLIKAQLTELLTDYGEIPAIVFDGWDCGWARLDYSVIPFQEIYDHIKSLQPRCLVIEHNAKQYPEDYLFYADVKHFEQNAGQNISLANQVPAQSGPCLQSSWFWKTTFPNEELKPVRSIIHEWLIPFNRAHTNLLLNVAINREGTIDANALARLAEVGRAMPKLDPVPQLPPQGPPILTPNLALRRKTYCSSYFGSSGPDLVNDGNFRSFWSCGYGRPGGWIEIDLETPVRFNTVAFTEPVGARGYSPATRIRSYKVECLQADGWTAVAAGNAAAMTRVHRFGAVTARRVRLSFEAEEDMPGISEFGVYNEPERTL